MVIEFTLDRVHLPPQDGLALALLHAFGDLVQMRLRVSISSSRWRWASTALRTALDVDGREHVRLGLDRDLGCVADRVGQPARRSMDRRNGHREEVPFGDLLDDRAVFSDKALDVGHVRRDVLGFAHAHHGRTPTGRPTSRHRTSTDTARVPSRSEAEPVIDDDAECAERAVQARRPDDPDRVLDCDLLLGVDDRKLTDMPGNSTASSSGRTGSSYAGPYSMFTSSYGLPK